MTSAAARRGLSAPELRGIAGVMEGAGVPLCGPLSSTLIARGRSNLTFRITDGTGRWVLRTPPRIGRTPSAHDVAREYRVTAALASSDVPVPPAVVVCEHENIIGGPFAIAEFVPGVTVQTRAELDAVAVPVRVIVRRLLESLAALHQVDYSAVGLGSFGRPDGYAARQLRRWSGQWGIVGPPQYQQPASELVRRLQAAIPEQRTSSIVHGDFRIDNTILDLNAPAGPKVAAVVDWELSTIGDPVADVAMMCAYRHEAFDLIVGDASAWASPSLPAVSELAALYEDIGGVELVDWEFHLALAYFKVAVIAAGIDHRARVGAAAGAGFDAAGRSVLPFLDLGLRTIGGAA